MSNLNRFFSIIYLPRTTEVQLVCVFQGDDNLEAIGQVDISHYVGYICLFH